MDSRLLNAFHDDPFDGNYVKYDTDTQFWPNENGSLELQLADTLHGILPIAPTEVVSNNLFNNSLLKEADYSLESKHCSNTNSIMYDTYEDLTPNGMVNKRQLSSQQTIEIISVDPNGDYDSEFIGSTDEDSDDYDDGDDQENNAYEQTRGIVAFDEVRCFSRSTFRSRTDSSSIGDYESHSSDYDDDDDEDEAMDFQSVHSNATQSVLEKNIKIDENNCAFATDANDLKNNTVDADIDPFAMQLDVNTFDLAAFITQDDQVFENQHRSSTKAAPVASKNISLQKVIVPSTTISSDSDLDSDVIVDVETVENDDDVVSVDAWENVESDSSWNTNKTTTTTTTNQKAEEEGKEIEKKQTTKPIEPNFSRNFTVLPNKRQSDFLKRKLGGKRDTNILQTIPKLNSKLKSIKRISNLSSSNNNNVVVEDKTKSNSIGHAEKKLPTNIKKPEVVVSPIKINIETKTVQTPKQNSVIILDKNTKFIIENEEPVVNQIKQKSTEDTNRIIIDEILHDHGSSIIIEAPMKRKLNLEEYKKRRENSLANTINSKHKTIRTETSSVHMQTTAMPPINTKLSPKRPLVTNSVTSIVKSLKESQSTKRFVDPITEAKNKVLRLQELKKAQQIKIIDSTVSSKVARVTKILPLKDIVKGSSYKHNQLSSNETKHSEYEEIIIVSMGCNTDITIPPNGYSTIEQKSTSGKNSHNSNSLLKSNVLLANISNSFQKVRSDESVKISSNSLIASIQDVVVKNSAPISPPVSNELQKRSNQSSNEHGENKIIMHLRKNRIRKRNFTQSTQTDLQSEFPALPLPKVQLNGGGDNSKTSFARSRDRKLRRKYRSRHNSYSSDEESSNNYRSQGGNNKRRSISKHSRRHRNSISSSLSESDNDYSKRNRRNSVYSSRSRGRSISSSGRSRSKSYDRNYRNSKSRSKSPSRSSGRGRGRSGSGSRRRDFIARRYERTNTAAPAVEERRIVYVGRIERDTTKELLRKKFIAYGPIKLVTVHYKDTGMKYGFVTYEKSEDAFRVIDSGQNDAAINMYDISFGGRRAFCRSSYADLDNAGINTYESYVVPRQILPPKQEDSFEALLSTVKAKLNATKASSSSVTNSKT